MRLHPVAHIITAVRFRYSNSNLDVIPTICHGLAALTGSRVVLALSMFIRWSFNPFSGALSSWKASIVTLVVSVVTALRRAMRQAGQRRSGSFLLLFLTSYMFLSRPSLSRSSPDRSVSGRSPQDVDGASSAAESRQEAQGAV